MNSWNMQIPLSMMNNFKLLLFIAISSCLLAGCAKTFDNIDEYEKYVKGDDYPYLQTATRNGIQVSLRYMPTDAMMLQDYRNYEREYAKAERDTSLTKQELTNKIDKLTKKISQQRKTYFNSLYFVLTLGFEDDKNDIVYNAMNTGFDNYSDWLQQLLFGLKENIYLRTPNISKIPLSIYHMDRTYGMTKSRSLILVFPKEFNEIDLSQQRELKMIIREFGLHTGRFVFDYKLPFTNIKLKNYYNEGD